MIKLCTSVVLKLQMFFRIWISCPLQLVSTPHFFIFVVEAKASRLLHVLIPVIGSKERHAHCKLLSFQQFLCVT